MRPDDLPRRQPVDVCQCLAVDADENDAESAGILPVGHFLPAAGFAGAVDHGAFSSVCAEMNCSRQCHKKKFLGLTHTSLTSSYIPNRRYKKCAAPLLQRKDAAAAVPLLREECVVHSSDGTFDVFIRNTDADIHLAPALVDRVYVDAFVRQRSEDFRSDADSMYHASTYNA